MRHYYHLNITGLRIRNPRGSGGAEDPRAEAGGRWFVPPRPQAAPCMAVGKRGYTLIEALVVGLIAALLGVGLISILSWIFGTSQLDEKRAHLQTEASVIQEDISRRVRISSTVDTLTSKTLRFYNGATESSRITISGDTLRESGSAYRVSGRPVLLVGDSSFFTADSNGEFASVRLVLRRDNARYTLSTGMLRCRN